MDNFTISDGFGKLQSTDGHVSILVLISITSVFLLSKTFLYLRSLYRIHFHPLRSFPGPREAAKSDKWLYRQTKSIYPEDTYEKLHRDHQAKAIRIAPNELHINDPSLYKVIYKQSNPFPKHEAFYLGFNQPFPTLFTEIDGVKHKERRRLLNPLFSRAGVLKLEGLVWDRLRLLEAKIERLREQQDINLYDAFRLLTTTIIMEFCFADSGGMLDEEPTGFSSKFLRAFTFASEGVSTLQHYPLFRVVSNMVPASILKTLSPEVGGMMELLDFAEACVNRWRQSEAKAATVDHPIVLDHLESLSDVALVSEALDLLIAGSDTSAMSLTTALFEVLRHPDMEKRLVDELDAAIPDKNNFPSVQELEKISYLTACVKEGIRFASAVPGRLPRVVPRNESDPFVVDGKIVPPGTIVSVSAHTMHSNVEIWGPDARCFNPDRWLSPEAKSLEQYQVSFSKGARMCIGQNLVPIELIIVLATIFRKYKLSFPSGFIPPRRVDNFTIELEGGLPLKMTPRA
ncbi:cytochrome p450 [Colletotrichum karsti]|uniref:Cytochrome p450 n=1 Tax=Colletotrichum karsti TaxID=1095194 RepID=A0A9P6HYL0_9PEZI|nr:cytochrome p450 [Colletotrichum karsti]KAF9873228.1 cytochrome p450 [Colletotrichum karsti]